MTINRFSINISFQEGRNFLFEGTKKPTKSTFAKTLPNSILTCASFIGAWRKKRIYYRLCIYTLAEIFSEKAKLISPDFPDVFSSSPFTIPTSFNGDRVVSKVFTVTEDSWRLQAVYNLEKNIEQNFLNFLPWGKKYRNYFRFIKYTR